MKNAPRLTKLVFLLAVFMSTNASALQLCQHPDGSVKVRKKCRPPLTQFTTINQQALPTNCVNRHRTENMDHASGTVAVTCHDGEYLLTHGLYLPFPQGISLDHFTIHYARLLYEAGASNFPVVGVEYYVSANDYDGIITAIAQGVCCPLS